MDYGMDRTIHSVIYYNMYGGIVCQRIRYTNVHIYTENITLSIQVEIRMHLYII